MSLHAAGKTVITWTVNDPRKMLQAAAMGVDGIISDDTKLLVETLGTNPALMFPISHDERAARPSAPSRLLRAGESLVARIRQEADAPSA